MIDVVKDGETIPAKVVYVRNCNKRKEYLCLISTDVNLDENEIIRIYGKHWDIEVFFKVCKSYLNLSRECNSLSYDAMTTHNAVVFTRYMMLSLESGNPMITCLWASSFYTFQMKCLISHGYRLFKCCSKCSEQCFQITLNFQTKKSMNWRMHLWMHFLL